MEPAPPLDLKLFQTLQTRADDLFNDLNNVAERLQAQMKNMAAITVESSNIYKETVEHLSKEVSLCTSQTVQLITQCDELDKDLAQLHALSRQIKTIDKALDQLQQAI
ncbi:hypothetical protein BX666DRAFT_2026931 [Dichotomocladium elegans]|nr:hypothetical protein BX666DRAFT_2026931 [Dichotomocladium elegans]